MDKWFASISAGTGFSSKAISVLQTDGFVVIPGPVPSTDLLELARTYDQAVTDATPEDVKIGSTNTRVSDFVNRNAEFDCLYLHPPLLQACCRVIEQPFKLSTMHARTVRPYVPAQRLHVDFPSDAQGWPMVGFIFTIDDFTPENGATCFVRGSQGKRGLSVSSKLTPACGPAGSMIVFNGSVWHGHGPNQTNQSRRSIQGAYIRRTEISGANLPARMQPETLHRFGELAKYLLAL
jgi:ectoine hydroxylase-related dioxygenase (phytanoyl-CoA dioxygenase family)